MYRVSLLKGINWEKDAEEFPKHYHFEGHHQNVGHHSDISENRTSPPELMKGQEVSYQGGCQGTYGNIKGVAGIFRKYWSLSACNNHPYSVR